MAKATDTIDKLKADRAALVEFAQYIRNWARFNDHGIKMRATAALAQVGEDQEAQ